MMTMQSLREESADAMAPRGLRNRASAVKPRSLSICLINPRFEPSFFGREYELPILPGDKRSVMLGCGLPLIAALVPQGHSIVILDENVEEIDFDSLRGAYDVIGVTGMIVQKQRMAEILLELRETGALLCVGGPFITVDAGFFEKLCDVMFIGEADETWPRFLRDLAEGRAVERRYKQEAATDMSSLPTPRFDLARTARYATAAVQFSRGCPFLCEFCDIIVTFGRRPRVKTAQQILDEFDVLLTRGVRHVFLVDDNFIGNKAQAKIALKAIIGWQESHGYPLNLTTEASINLGDEPELLNLMWRAGFRSVFVGIESPRADSLLETRKVQNVRGDSIEAKLDRIREAGMIVQAGFIVGFDNDDERVFDEIFHLAQNAGLGIAAVSILSPIPTTPLHDRLMKAGRLNDEDDLVWFEPLQMSRETLKKGYRELNMRLYSPKAFFERVFGGFERSAAFRDRRTVAMSRTANPRSTSQRVVEAAAVSLMAWRLARALAVDGQLVAIGGAYVATYLAHTRALGREAMPLGEYIALCVRHWHHFRIAGEKSSYWGRAGEAAPALATAN